MEYATALGVWVIVGLLVYNRIKPARKRRVAKPKQAV
mgnify:CR=1 FL=1